MVQEDKMKKFLAFVFTLIMCITAHSTGLTDLKFGQYQIADSQWNVQACTQTTTCQIYSKNPGTAYKIPWTSGQISWAPGDYIAFATTGNATNPWNAIQYSSNGTQKAVMGTGHIINMGTDYFFFVGNDNNTGQLFSMTQGFSNTSGVTWTGTLNPTVSQVNTYAAGGSTTPLAAGQTASPTPPPPPPPVDNSTAAGTMPGGYIGRVLNNTPGQFQNYSFTYTPTVTGSQYVQLAFRQDPAFWTVTNVSLTAGGSSTNLLQNGNFATGGTITAQTNNGPMDVNTPTYWGVAYQAGIYPGAAGFWSTGQWYDGAVGSFDAIYQGVNLTAGVTYTITITVRGDNTSDTSLSGGVQLGVYAGPCGNVSLAPDQCTMPSNSGYSTLSTPSQGASAGNTTPTVVSTSTSDDVSTTTSTSTSTQSNPNGFTINNTVYDFNVNGSSTVTTVTTTTTPVTTTNWSDGTTTTSSGTPVVVTTSTTSYTVTGPAIQPTDVNPYQGTTNSGVYITQSSGYSNTVNASQSGHGNLQEIYLAGSSNSIKAGQGFTFNSLGIASESASVSTFNVLGINVSGNSNTVLAQQTGSTNSSIINISGNGNSAIVSQNGNNNQNYNLISGNNNYLTVNQTGNSALASINLYGNGNSASVTQTGSQATLLNLTNAGGPNNVSVTQYGSSTQTYSVQQTCTTPAGCSATIVQH
jgi:hypothetical protein